MIACLFIMYMYVVHLYQSLNMQRTYKHELG